MAVNKIPESQLPVRSVSDTDYVRIVGADGKSYRVPKTDFNGGGGGGGTVDPSLSPTSTNAVQNKAIYSALSGLKDDLGDLSDLDTTVKTDLVSAINEVAQGGGGSGLTEDIKTALLQIASKVAYIDDDGQTYYQDLYDAFYPPVGVTSITAVYTQSGTVYDTDSLDSLKADLVVTAYYEDSTSAVVTSYTLSGTLTVGTSTITVTYGGKTATFTVTVAQAATLTSISCVYTQSGTVYATDSLDSLKSDLVVTAHYSDSSTATVASSDYTLSGTLTVGTSTITVTYDGETDTFSVSVTVAPLTPIHSYDFTQGLQDLMTQDVATLSASGVSQSSAGITFTSSNGGAVQFMSSAINPLDKTFEIDISGDSTDNLPTSGYVHARLFGVSSNGTNNVDDQVYFGRRMNQGTWSINTGSGGWDTNPTSTSVYTKAFLIGKTVKLYVSGTGEVTVSFGNIGSDTFGNSHTFNNVAPNINGYMAFGCASSNNMSGLIITGLRVYNGQV